MALALTLPGTDSPTATRTLPRSSSTPDVGEDTSKPRTLSLQDLHYKAMAEKIANKSRRRRYENFVDRNYWTEQCATRRQFACTQRSLREEEQRFEEDMEMSWGMQGAEGFRKLLRARCGSIPTAWRLVLDRDGNGLVSFGELRQCCHEIGFSGNLKKLWTELDADGDGFISLGELDAEACEGLAGFRQFCLDGFGSTLAAWTQGINPQGAPSVTEQKFTGRCKALGYEGDASKLFGWLRTDMGRKDLVLMDFDPRTAAALFRADPCAESFSLGGKRRALSNHSPKATRLSPHSGKAMGPALHPRPAMAGSAMVGSGRSPLAAAATLDLRSGSAASSPSRSMTSTLGPIQGAAAAGEPQPREARGLARRSMSLSQLGDASSSAISFKMPSPLASTSPGRSRLLDGSFGQSLGRSDPGPSPTRSSEWTRELSTTQIAERHEKQRQEEEASCGMRSLGDLKAGLCVRYGSLYTAWQQVLDPHSKGKIAFKEFCDCLRQLGYIGDMKQLWASLGCTPSGFVRFGDLDPRAERLLADLRRTMKDAHGNMLNAWRAIFDSTGRGGVDEATFIKQCQQAGFAGDAAQVFRLLRGREGKFLTLRNFDLQAHRAFEREDHGMITEEQDRRSPLTMTFDERQQSTFNVKWITTLSVAERSAYHEQVQQQQAMDVGCNEAEALKAMLVRKYGSLVAAWRLGLDPMDLGKLSFEAFSQAVRRLGYCGDLRGLWAEVARPGAPCLLLHDLDPEAAEALWAFRAWLLEKFGNIVAAWHKGLDPKGYRRLEELAFCARLQELGYPSSDTKVLFQMLKADPDRHFITHADVDQAAADAHSRGDKEAFTMTGTKLGPRASPHEWPGRASDESFGLGPQELQQKEGVVRHTRATKWSEKLGQEHRAGLKREEQEERERQFGIRNLNGFRQKLVDRFGSTLAAWRAVFDPDGIGRLSSGHFRDALQRLGGFSGSAKQLWADLDTAANGYITLKELDEESSKVLDGFREFLLGHFTTLLDAWHLGLDTEANDQLGEAAFVASCAALGLPAESKQVRRLFRMLLPDRSSGRKVLLAEDLRSLLLSVPEAERRAAMWSGTDSPSAVRGRRLEVSQLAANHREEIGLDTSPEDFRKLLVRTFGSVYAGWVRCLAVAQEGRVPMGCVPMGTFVLRAKAIGASGNVKDLFNAMDKKGKDFITLHDLDPESSEAITSFLELAKEKCGSILDAWRLALDVGRSGRVGEEDFVRGCEWLGYPGDAAQLFALLRAEPGRHYLHLEDLGSEAASQARRRPLAGSPKGTLTAPSSQPGSPVSRSPQAAGRRRPRPGASGTTSPSAVATGPIPEACTPSSTRARTPQSWSLPELALDGQVQLSETLIPELEGEDATR